MPGELVVTNRVTGCWVIYKYFSGKYYDSIINQKSTVGLWRPYLYEQFEYSLHSAWNSVLDALIDIKSFNKVETKVSLVKFKL